MGPLLQRMQLQITKLKDDNAALNRHIAAMGAEQHNRHAQLLDKFATLERAVLHAVSGAAEGSSGSPFRKRRAGPDPATPTPTVTAPPPASSTKLPQPLQLRPPPPVIVFPPGGTLLDLYITWYGCNLALDQGYRWTCADPRDSNRIKNAIIFTTELLESCPLKVFFAAPHPEKGSQIYSTWYADLITACNGLVREMTNRMLDMKLGKFIGPAPTYNALSNKYQAHKRRGTEEGTARTAQDTDVPMVVAKASGSGSGTITKASKISSK
jgi:hypothetical protein